MRSRPSLKKPQQTVIRRHKPSYQLVLYMGLLLLLGLIVMYAIGPQRANLLNFAYGSDYGDSFFFNKQLISAVVAVVAFSFCAFLPYKILTEKLASTLFISGMVLCVLLVFFGAVLHLPFATEANGAYRWFQLPGFGSFQPSELLKFGAMLFVGGFLGRRAAQGKINHVNDTLVPLAISVGLSMFIVVVMQKDLGTGISLVAIILSMLVVSGMKKQIIMKAIAGLAIAGMLFIVTAPHRVDRVMTFMRGDSNSQTEADSGSYHIQQARIAMGSGGLLGLGIGKSVQATGYLPEAINDSIFAILGETFGFAGSVVILLLFTALLLAVLKVASRLPDLGLRLVVAGIFGWIASHVIMNVAAMTGVAPLTGIPLPLLSYGGTSMLSIAAALGLAFQLSRYTSHKPLTEGEGSGQDFSNRRWVGRTRHAGNRSF